MAKLVSLDVVELYANENNQPKRIGLGYIPTIKASRICNENISEEKFTFVKCKINNYFKKWEPIEIYKSSELSINKVAQYNQVNNINKHIIC